MIRDNGFYGIYLAGTTTISNSEITGNNFAHVSVNGGGIYNTGSLTLNEVLVAENYAIDSGGGIYNLDAELTIIDSTIEKNDASRGAGIFHRNDGGGNSVTIRGSSILENATYNGASGGHRGGGLYVYSFTSPQASVSIANSTFSANTANIGGAVFVNGSANLEFVNSTITANTALQQAGGIFNNAATPGTVILHNTILAENTAGISNTGNVTGSLNAASSYNLIGLGNTGGLTHGINGNIVLISGQSAGLTALGNYGGPTKTHGLLSTSIAIDAADDAIALMYGLDFDQRGDEFDRIVDGDNDLDPQVDIGAFEFGA